MGRSTEQVGAVGGVPWTLAGLLVLLVGVAIFTSRMRPHRARGPEHHRPGPFTAREVAFSVAVLVVPVSLMVTVTIVLGDRQSDGPELLNATERTIWFELVRQSGTLGRPVPLKAGEVTEIDGHTDPCLSFDWLRITDPVSRHLADKDVLLEHDLQAKPICEGETWVFNGTLLERAW